VNLNDGLANDRTFLAWFRTGLALYAFGFVVAKVAFFIKHHPKGLSERDFYTITGVLIVLCGAAVILVGYWQYRAVIRAEASADDAPPARWPISVTVAAVAGSLLMAALILVTT